MKRIVAVLLGLFMLSLGAPAALAQAFPTKPVHLIVPFPPGGPLDISARLIGKELSDRWGQQVIVENKAGNTVGTESVVRSDPDGYTMLIISSTPLISRPHMQKVPYDVLKDLTGVTQTVLLTYALVVNPKSGITSLDDLIAKAKKSPGKLNFASAGNGSGQHLYMELLKNAAGIDLTHVPYKGAAPALNAVMSGEVPMMLDVTIKTIPLVKSGRARAILVTGSETLDALPGAVPFDKRFPGIGIPGWHGIFVPSATPKAVQEKLQQAVHDAVLKPAIAKRFRELGVEPSGVSGDAFNAIVRRDYGRWGEIIRKNHLHID